MRILFISPCNGIGAHEEKFLAALSERGYQTRVFAYHYTRMQDRLAALPGVTVEFVPLRIAGKVQRALSFHMLPRLKRTIREFKPDVIHSGNSWNDSFLAGLTGFHPLLVMPYGSDVLLDPERFRMLDWFNRIAFRAADWVTVDAERVKDTVIRRYHYPPAKITVIPWGVDVEGIAKLRSPWRDSLRKELGWDSDFVVMMNRHHEGVYGIDVFLEAMTTVVKENANVRVLFIGGGSLTPAYMEYIRDHHLAPSFFTPGKIPRDLLYKYLHAADLYVSSSHSDGTSVSLLEAMAARLGVVVTDVPSILEWVVQGENGEVVPRGDSQALAGAILRASRDPGQVRRYGEHNLAVVRSRADWAQNFRAFEGLYHTLVQGDTCSK
jgi:L-malate glycosyltransferase